jgi:hypothetical protein
MTHPEFSPTVICLPRGVCSRNYQFPMPSGEIATLTYARLFPRGTIACGETEYAVRKQKLLIDEWTFEREGRVVARGRALNSLVHIMLLEVGDHTFTIKPAPRFLYSGHHEVDRDGEAVGKIKFEHANTDRAQMEWAPEVSEHIQLFSFWLAVLSWRRQHSSS